MLPVEKEYQNISLLMEYIFINGQTYFFTKSSRINFQYIQACMGRGKAQLKKGLCIVNQTYESRGFNITQYYSNNKFEKIRPYLLPSKLHICAVYEPIIYVVHPYMKVCTGGGMYFRWIFIHCRS